VLAIFGARIGVDRASLKEREIDAPMCYLGVNRSSVPGEIWLIAAVDPEATSKGDVFEHAHRATVHDVETGAVGAGTATSSGPLRRRTATAASPHGLAAVAGEDLRPAGQRRPPPAAGSIRG